MRTRILGVVALGLAGCAGTPAPAPNVPGIYAVDEITRANPVGDAPVAAVEIHRGPSASLHVVQVTKEVAWHSHAHSDETVFLYRGAGVMYVGDTATELLPGMAAFVPRGVAHRFQCTSAEPAVGLSMFAPPLRAGDRVPVQR